MKKLPRVYPKQPSPGRPPLSIGDSHPDALAVDRFAVEMKVKLARKRAEGRGGWENKEECSADSLSQLLREHVDKGDPIDVANFAMMLHQRGERITPDANPLQGEPAAWLVKRYANDGSWIRDDLYLKRPDIRSTAKTDFIPLAPMNEIPDANSPSPETHLRSLADAIAERARQIEAEGWSTEHDDSHAHGEMARAAAAYCLGQQELMGRVQDGKRFLPWRSMIWPWSKEWWKPKTRREDLIRAAALIIAEIERLDRATAAEDGR